MQGLGRSGGPLLGPAQVSVTAIAGAGMEGAGQQDFHVHRTPRLAHRLAAGREVQENPQKHHDQPDGHSGGGHREAGEGGTAPRLGGQGGQAALGEAISTKKPPAGAGPGGWSSPKALPPFRTS